ncbi:MAG TPA: hypothetical protein VK939_04345 [Longimicrobiales bacterium]|nr:hypothetical protein [Longimicrobiales bacterium]
MMKQSHWAALLVALSLAVLPSGCGRSGDDDRSALADDELDRDLDLALQADSAPVTFQDTAESLPQAEPEAPAPAVTVPQPRPRTPAPARAQPEPEPEPVRREPLATTATAEVGTNFSITLHETISTETNRVGDAFTATVREAVLSSDGQVVVPAGAVVRGRLTQVDKSGNVGETAVIKIAFESVSFAGRSLPLDATVVRAEPQRRSRASTGEQAGKVAAGAAAGALLGRVLGKDTKSTIGGAVIGAAAGTAIAMGTADVDVVLPAGSEMVIRLDAPIEVRSVL